jgi:hypothetical protein
VLLAAAAVAKAKVRARAGESEGESELCRPERTPHDSACCWRQALGRPEMRRQRDPDAMDVNAVWMSPLSAEKREG